METVRGPVGLQTPVKYMARPEGFEPPTRCLEGYGLCLGQTKNRFGDRRKPEGACDGATIVPRIV